MSKANDDSKLYKLLKFLISPVMVGIYVTLSISYISSFYYENKEALKSNSLIQIISEFDQISIDTRLKLRGVKPPAPNVGVLAIDDRSIEIVGRWPWPRNTIAQAVANAYKYGAKIIAADIVWSEPTDRPELRLADDLSKKSLITPEARNLIDVELKKNDPDLMFSETLQQYKNKFIVGNFFKESNFWYNQKDLSGYRIFCHDIMFKNHQFKTIFDLQAIPIVDLDSAVTFFPKEFELAYQNRLNDLEENIKFSQPVPKNSFEEYQLAEKIVDEKANFCENIFLNPKYDHISQAYREQWSAIKTQIANLDFDSFDEWLTNFKNKNLYNAIPETLHWTFTIPTIANNNENFGYFNAALDSDGKIRRTQLITRTGSNFLPSIALQAYLVANDYHAELKMGKTNFNSELKGIQEFKISNSDGDLVYNLPITYDGFLQINYRGPGKTIPHASIADLLDEKNPNILVTQKILDHQRGLQEKTTQVSKADFFKDKILVLGATAIGVYDLRVTPFDENFPGVETHANVIDNLIRQDFLSRIPAEEYTMPFILLALGIVLSLALTHFGALWGLSFTVLSIAAISFIDKNYFFSKGHIISVFFPLFQVVFTYVVLTFYKYLTEERNKKELRATFSKYVSPAIVEEILKHPKNLELGGRKENVTIFFSDVRGFTTISEKLDPRALSDLLNSYLTPMTELVFKNNGTLDKYMGDAIMAFFGAPVHYPDHAKMACLCALQNMEKLKELQATYIKKKLPQIDIGIGLNTGECSVGNMGSETVRSYTVMGDAVNLASRLEGINKSYGTHIIISEFTHEYVQNDFLCREIDWVQVKGKLKPVKIYELLGETNTNPQLLEMSKYFASAYDLYHKKQFAQAIASFQKSIDINPQDETSKIYIQRCQNYIATPPAEDWDGVYVMKTK